MSFGYNDCRLCARNCGVNRERGELGFCAMSADVEIARAALHFWEEPPISVSKGSGTVLFVGCSLGCSFCQNRDISRASSESKRGKRITESRLADIMLNLESQGAHNINFVTPTHFAPSVISATRIARSRGLSLPIVYNTGSYDSKETVEALDGTVDVYLVDYKFHRESTAKNMAHAADYPDTAREVIASAIKQKGSAVIENGIMKSGVIVRILLLPGHVAEAKLAVKYLYEAYGDKIYISLMNQYTPMPDMPSPLDRRVTAAEYDELCDYAIKKGIKNAFIQEGGTAEESFIPPFDLTGVESEA